jgi:maleylacetate reductase
MEFVYGANPSRVIFAAGARSRVGEELDRLGVKRAMVVTTPSQADVAAQFARLIGERAGIVYPGAQMHTPTNVTEAALTAVSSVKADGILAVGGGSAIGMSKAIALRTDLPQVVVPVTFSGSEMTPILGETERGEKLTQRSAKVLPETVIYDPELASGLPPHVAGPSAMNAIAHAVEALYARDGNPMISAIAENAIRILAGALPRFLADRDDRQAWSDALCGAWMAGSCLGAATLGIQHKLCHTLGGMFDLNHADLHAVMLPYSAAFNREAAPEAMRRAANALDAGDAPTALYELMLRATRATSLKDMGLTRTALEKAADLAAKDPYDNPRPVTRDNILELLLAAHEGGPPNG